ICILDSDNNVVVSPWDDDDTQLLLKGILPENEYQKSVTVASHGLSKGNYTVVMRVVNPLSNGKAVKFCNVNQDAQLDGWLTLGAFTVN
ncbi:MAG: hypothetical protein LUG48_07975, partial [Klebsiella quasipneumoniae]|nr:hypothetical protein [Klebsiella quasipneumoniae]